MMSRKLSEYRRMLVAGAQYASSRSDPVRPGDLEDWDWIQYAQRGDAVKFTSKTGETETVIGNSQIQVDSVDALYHYTRQNLGATVLPWHLAKKGLDTGEFVQLLPDWGLSALGCFAVWPDKSRRESLTLLLVRFLAAKDNY